MPYQQYGTVNRWLSARFLLLSSCIVALVALIAVMTPTIDASLAGFALAFSDSLLMDVSTLPLVYRRYLTHGSF